MALQEAKFILNLLFDEKCLRMIQIFLKLQVNNLICFTDKNLKYKFLTCFTDFSIKKIALMVKVG